MDDLKNLLSLLTVGSVNELPDRVEQSLTTQDLQGLVGDFDSFIRNQLINLFIDGEVANSWEELTGISCSIPCRLVIYKRKVIEDILKPKLDDINIDNIQQYLFLTLSYFSKWLENLDSPFKSSNPLYLNNKTILWVHGINKKHVGTHLLVSPLLIEEHQEYSDESLGIPEDEKIRTQVHFVSNESVKIEPSRFYLPESSLDEKVLLPIFKFYESTLACCLVKEFFNEEKVIVSGIKRVTTSLVDKLYTDVTYENINKLEEAVRWVYSERTETRLLLLMDRISLDLTENSLIPSIYKYIDQAIEQARCRYEFVIKDRKEAHAKELSDLQKDIKTATDSYSKSATELVSGLLKDALSSIFILAIALFSRLIGNSSVLESTQIHWLFNGLAVYLLISVSVRIYLGKASLKLALRDLTYWKNASRNHMSESEFKNHIELRTKEYKCFYNKNAILVSIVYVMLSIFVVCLPNLISSDKSPKAQIEKEIDIKDKTQNETDSNNIPDLPQHSKKTQTLQK